MTHLQDDHSVDARLPVDARLKEFKATVRNIPLVDEYDGPGKCVVTGERVEQRVVVARLIENQRAEFTVTSPSLSCFS